MASGRKIVIEFLGKDKNLGSTADGIAGKTSKMGDRLKTIGKVGAVAFAAAGVAAVKFGIDSSKALARIETINAQTKAAIDSTGGAAGVTAKHVENLAGRIENMTAQEAEAVQEGANLLLTFTKVRNEAGKGNKIFDQATSIMTDMSVAMGTDVKSSAMLVGKALNDPIKGVAALTRAGVQLTDQQKKQIEGFVESGETMKAQKIILGELTTQFGGSGKAFAATASGQFALVQHRLGAIGETIMTKLMPHLTRFTGWILKDAIPAAERMAKWLSANLGPAFSKVGAIVGKVFGGLSGKVSGPLADIRSIIKDFISIVRSLWKRFGKDILSYAQAAWKNMKAIIGGALKVISGIFKVFSSALKGDWKGVWQGIKQILSGALGIIKALIRGAMDTVKLIFRTAWSAIKGIVSGAWDGIKTIARNGADWLVDAIRSIPDRLRNLAGVFASAGKALIQGFVDGMKNAAGVIAGIAGNVWDAVKDLLNGAISKINAALEFTIKLPGPDITINPPDIPQLAKGGVVKARPGGTLALLGEGGHDEAVIPLTGPHARRRGVAPPSTGGNIIVNISGALDPVAVGRQVEQVLVKYQRATGRPLQVRTS